MDLDYASPTLTERPVLPVLSRVFAIGSIVGFLCFVAIDASFVWFAPSHITEYDWIWLFFPVSIGVMAAYKLKFLDPFDRVVFSIICAVLTSVMVIALAIFPGLWIHVRIGGTL